MEIGAELRTFRPRVALQFATLGFRLRIGKYLVDQREIDVNLSISTHATAASSVFAAWRCLPCRRPMSRFACDADDARRLRNEPGRYAARRVTHSKGVCMSAPCIITVAITGSVPKKTDNPAVPITRSRADRIDARRVRGRRRARARARAQRRRHDDVRIPRSSAASSKASASIAPTSSCSSRPAAAAATGNERGGMLHHRPDMASLSTGSVNFKTMIYENHPKLIVDLATTHARARREARDRDLRPRDALQRREARRRTDLLKPPVHVQFVLGIPNSLPADRRSARVRDRAARARCCPAPRGPRPASAASS